MSEDNETVNLDNLSLLKRRGGVGWRGNRSYTGRELITISKKKRREKR
jgi:hypothetical protein